MRFIPAEIHEHVAWGVIVATLLLSLAAAYSLELLAWTAAGLLAGIIAVIWTERGKGHGH